MKHSLAESEDVNLLMEQFKFHLIYRNRSRQSQGELQSYKEILSQIKQSVSHKAKKQKILQQQEKDLVAKQGAIMTPLMNRIWFPQSVNNQKLMQLEQKILMVDKQKQDLKNEIAMLEAGFSQSRKQVAELRRQVQKASKHQQQFKHISYLAKSIDRTTQSTKIKNYRSYQKMVKYQEGVLVNLKKFRTNLRKQNEDQESRILQSRQNKSRVACKKKKDQQKQLEPKISKIFINKLGQLLTLLKNNQQHYQQLKVQLTTRVRLKKINKQYLSQERGKMHFCIDKFQKNHDLQIHSLTGLIVHFYHKIKKQTEQTEDSCIRANQVRNLLQEELINCRPESARYSLNQQKYQKICRFSLYQKHLLQMNSQICLKTLNLFHYLLGKFKYLFTMALTLNVQKKHFNDLLEQLTNIYRNQSLFIKQQIQCRGNDETQITAQQLLVFWQNHGQKHLLTGRQLIDFFFYDCRLPLLFGQRFTEQFLLQGLQQNNIFETLQSFIKNSEEIFGNSLKFYNQLLINSFKSLNLNKYQRKIVQNSNAFDNIFMSSVKPSRIVEPDSSYETASCEPKDAESSPIIPLEKADRQVKIIDAKKGVRSIVQQLQKLKNQEKKCFKVVNFKAAEVYMYGSRQVVLPRYAI